MKSSRAICALALAGVVLMTATPASAGWRGLADLNYDDEGRICSNAMEFSLASSLGPARVSVSVTNITAEPDVEIVPLTELPALVFAPVPELFDVATYLHSRSFRLHFSPRPAPGAELLIRVLRRRRHRRVDGGRRRSVLVVHAVRAQGLARTAGGDGAREPGARRGSPSTFRSWEDRRSSPKVRHSRPSHARLPPQPSSRSPHPRRESCVGGSEVSTCSAGSHRRASPDARSSRSGPWSRGCRRTTSG